jgi:hypothetical protein
MRTMRILPVALTAALAGVLVVLAAPAHAGRIPVVRLDSGVAVQLQTAERATVALPAESPVSSVRSALDDAAARTQTRLDGVAEAATAETAARARLKSCLDGARDAAAQQFVQSVVDGAPQDFNALVFSGAETCFSSQFPQAVGTRIDQFAEAAAGHANEVAYDELSGAQTSQPSTAAPYDTGGGTYDDGGGYDGGGGNGGAIAVGIILLVVAAGAAIVVFFARGRRV